MSKYDEIEWDDIREFALLGYVVGGQALTALFYEKMDALAKKKADNPRTAWRARPGIAVAKQLAKIWEYVDSHEAASLAATAACSLVGLAAGITAACIAWPWLGATWGGLLTLKGLGLAAGALGIGAGVAPVAAAATSFTCILALPSAVQIARGWKEIKAEFIAGREETRAWKREQKNPGVKPHPLVAAAEASKDEMTEQGTQERALLFQRLQAKFPQEFAEAVRRTDTDTTLRDKVQVMKPVKFKLQAKKKSWAGRMGGAA